MAWSDIFLPSGAQTADEQQANLDRLKALADQRLQARSDLSPEDVAAREQAIQSVQLESQDAAAAQGFVEGAKEGLNNVLNAPGQLVGAVGSGASQALWGVLKNIPWWAYLAAAGALFVWMGGLALLRGRLAR